MSVAVAASTDIVVPLELTIAREGVGGVTGQSPLVRVRDSTTIDSYLDFFDNTFKTAGWTTLDGSMSEIGSGRYLRTLDLSLITSLAIGNVLTAEYRVDDGGDIIGVAHDLIIIGTNTAASLAADVSLIRKSITNRMEEFPGNPGTLILWDDDAITPLLTWELRDAAGGGIISTVGCPAKRTAAV